MITVIAYITLGVLLGGTFTGTVLWLEDRSQRRRRSQRINRRMSGG